ncbi:amidohydrolase [Gulosibacter molinativorax]|uniref:Amidohydrolase n=1 Tax=Gulosibacter molinativorax TaxID=256821 RepID=A0ABT7C6C5_9MICO|nr:amidohydrolase [Gulosibacter molinativorax]MDJ1370763.1 amidohydrolase [Gulosibacter molinativorax]QUY63210.1 N-substituted formamide deformylase [Gulosibacter molinativorax]
MEIDLIVEADTIITLDAKRPTATRVGVLGGRIVGFDEELDGVTATRRDSFPGQVLVPGFIDAHCHTTWWGLGLTAVQLDQARGLEHLYSMIEDEVRRLADDPTAWIHGTGFNQKHHGGEYPDIARLDEITGEHPLYLRHTSGHASITNTATLKLIGALDEGFENPVGGEVVRDANGHPTGLLDEAAQSLIQSMLLPYSAEEIARALDAATRRYAAEGITSFTEAGVGGGWIGHSPIEVAGYQLAKASDRLHARAQLMPAIDSLTMLEGNAGDFRGAGHGLTAALGVGPGFGTDWIRLGHVKAFMDGSLLGKTAAVTEDYCGHDHNRGYLLNTPEQYREDVLATYRAGWPVALHAIGDAGIDMALDLIEECQDTYGVNDVPNRVEHFGIARPDQVERAGRLRITVTPQAGFIGPLGDQFAKNVGPEREGWLYRGRSVVEAGAILAGSSDLPVADNNIRRGMQTAVDRLTENGLVLGPEEGLTPEQALRSYTEWGAIGTGQIADKGTLERGKLADFVVLSDSPLTCDSIAKLDVIATFVGGAATYDSRANAR